MHSYDIKYNTQLGYNDVFYETHSSTWQVYFHNPKLSKDVHILLGSGFISSRLNLPSLNQVFEAPIFFKKKSSYSDIGIVNCFCCNLSTGTSPTTI